MAQISVAVKISKVPTMQISRMIQSVETHAEGEPGRLITVSTGPRSGILDRSPCGTGTCAKMAVLHARGLLTIGQDYVNVGPLGTTFTGRILDQTTVGPYRAIIPELSGQAWIYGTSNWTIDPGDPFPQGYQISDSSG